MVDSTYMFFWSSIDIASVSRLSDVLNFAAEYVCVVLSQHTNGFFATARFHSFTQCSHNLE